MTRRIGFDIDKFTGRGDGTVVELDEILTRVSKQNLIIEKIWLGPKLLESLAKAGFSLTKYKAPPEVKQDDLIPLWIDQTFSNSRLVIEVQDDPEGKSGLVTFLYVLMRDHMTPGAGRRVCRKTRRKNCWPIADLQQ